MKLRLHTGPIIIIGLLAAAGYVAMNSKNPVTEYLPKILDTGSKAVTKYCTFEKTVIQDGKELDIFNCGLQGRKIWLVEKNSWSSKDIKISP